MGNIMKFKLFGIIWDFTPIFGIVYAFVGLMLVASTFMMDVLGWWNILLFAGLILWVASVESVMTKLTKALDNDTEETIE